MSDPHFERLKEWSRRVLKKTPYKRFLLCLESECTELWDDLRGTGITPLVYGSDHSHLGVFLRRLHPGQNVSALWRHFAADNKGVTIIPSQLETPIRDEYGKVEGEVVDYSNSTAEMDLIKGLEDGPLSWFGFNSIQHLHAHVPLRWLNRSGFDEKEIEREIQFYRANDMRALRGRNLVIVGSPACNRVSNGIVRQIWNRLNTTRDRQCSAVKDWTSDLLKCLGETVLDESPTECCCQDKKRMEVLPSISNPPIKGRYFLTWAVVIRRVESITEGHESHECYDKSGGTRCHIILGGGERCRGPTHLCAMRLSRFCRKHSRRRVSQVTLLRSSS